MKCIDRRAIKDLEEHRDKLAARHMTRDGHRTEVVAVPRLSEFTDLARLAQACTLTAHNDDVATSTERINEARLAQWDTFISGAPAEASLLQTVHERLTEKGYKIPNSRAELEAQKQGVRDSRRLVCFISEAPRSGGDVQRTVLQIGPAAYALPPLTTVTLVASLEPGQWSFEGEHVLRRCLCVRVRGPY